MDFAFSPQQERLRQEVRDFLRENPPEQYPCEIRDEGYGFGGWSAAFSRALGERGWLGISWPKEYGGLGKSLMDMFIVKDEMAYHRAPTFAHFANESVAFSLLAYGNENQKKEFLPKMARAELFFCQALSEPNAGSDLLALKTRAEDAGDYFIINGQKIWNSGAFLADWAMLAVKTDLEAPGQRGISSILIDLRSPGITVRPITDMTGHQSLSEIFLEDVKVPKSNLLGELNKGFQQVLVMLEGDRFWGRCVRASGTRRTLDDIVKYCKETRYNGISLAEDSLVRDLLAEIAIEIEVCRVLTYRAIFLLDKGVALTHEASILKTFADELGQRAAEAWVRILGPMGQLMGNAKWTVWDGQIGHEYLFSPGLSIAGGTSEIQRTTIATRGLGLPR